MRLPPTQRFYQGMRDLVQILLSYDDKTMLMPASTTGHKPPIRQIEDLELIMVMLIMSITFSMNILFLTQSISIAKNKLLRSGRGNEGCLTCWHAIERALRKWDPPY